MTDHIERSGNLMPHEDRICLPSCQSKTEVFRLYKEDIETSKDEAGAVSWSSFTKMWGKYYRNVIIPKVVAHSIKRGIPLAGKKNVFICIYLPL